MIAYVIIGNYKIGSNSHPLNEIRLNIQLIFVGEERKKQFVLINIEKNKRIVCRLEKSLDLKTQPISLNQHSLCLMLIIGISTKVHYNTI
jgi:hypothetical protein